MGRIRGVSSEIGFTAEPGEGVREAVGGWGGAAAAAAAVFIKFSSPS